MSSTTIPAEILAFADTVRQALADLPPDEVDDLTDGLEADLAEEYAGEHPRPLPEPSAYAMELRTAAGLPPTVEVAAGLRAETTALARSARRSWDKALQSARNDPLLAAAVDFLGVLAPVWWVVRAFVGTWLLLQLVNLPFGGTIGMSPFFALAFALATIGSVQLGRGRWTFPGQETVTTLGNGLAILLLIPVWAGMFPGTSVEYVDSGEYDEGVPSEHMIATSLAEAGVTNIYAYDAEGQPLTNVQLFDQEGRPLNTLIDDENEVCDEFVCADVQPARLVTGSLAFSVFPLTVVPLVDDEGAEIVSESGEEGQDLQSESPLLKAPFVMVPGVDAIDEGSP